MNDVWFGDGATPADFVACLDALAIRDAQTPPLLAVTSGDAAPRLFLASRALFRLFGVADGPALSDRIFGGHDPGARRLATLSQGLAIDGAPRLERLRFFIGAGTEIITFLCRRIPIEGHECFVAAALGLRAGLIPADTVAPSAPPQAVVEPTIVRSHPSLPMNVQEIHARLRETWPASRTVRFLWQSDADLICTQVTPPLAEIIGAANADIVGRDLMHLASEIDPTGRLAEALATHATWSGLDVNWPLTDTPAAVSVGLGGIPAFDRDKVFEGYRGYGVIRLDKVVARPLTRLVRPPAEVAPTIPEDTMPESAPTVPEALPAPAPAPPLLTSAASGAKIVRFPGAKALSPEDEEVFAELGAELREEAGLNLAGLHPPEPEPPPAAVEDAAAHATGGTAVDRRAAEVARHGLAILDRLAIGILVSRDNIPIFANRHLLDLLGFADEDDLHAAGGMTHLFGAQPGNVTGSEAVGVRGRDGRIVPTSARMQTIEWDDLPATLLTLQKTTEPVPQPALLVPALAEPIAPVPDPSDQEPVVGTHAGGGFADRLAELRDLREILETATDGVAVIDADCNVIALNRSGEALFGCDRSAVVGKPFLDLFASHNRSLASDYLDGLKSSPTKRLLNDGREILVNARRGGAIPVFMTLGRLDTPAAADGEEPGGARFCALFRDLTHWKKVEQDLEAAKREAERVNALKSDFLAKVSHEVRTPLNAIIGFAEVMMEERFGPIGTERYVDYLRDIHASGTHVMSLVNDLLDLSKIEAGKMDLAVDAIDANKVIGECVALMQPQASRERVIMRLSLAPALPQIKADERSLRQIVLNLLSNAVKFNEPGGQVIVATTATDTGHVVIRIRDTGPGMSEADIAAALEPFRQVSTARKQEGGTGLGLPLTKALVEANQASFSIRSKIDQGTLVEVAFPPARVLAG